MCNKIMTRCSAKKALKNSCLSAKGQSLWLFKNIISKSLYKYAVSTSGTEHAYNVHVTSSSFWEKSVRYTMPENLPTFTRGEHVLNSLSFQPFPLTGMFSLFIPFFSFFFSFFFCNFAELGRFAATCFTMSVFHFTRDVNWKLIGEGDEQAVKSNRFS